MIAAPDTRQGRRALELAIEAAFFLPGSATHFATAFSTGGRKLHAADVNRIWAKAKQANRLPKINRPHGGPRERTVIPISAAEGRA